nr:nascent polypeptide-associated complex subunit alpha, muscle-specific form-like [Meriones unguiculatus]
MKATRTLPRETTTPFSGTPLSLLVNPSPRGPCSLAAHPGPQPTLAHPTPPSQRGAGKGDSRATQVSRDFWRTGPPAQHPGDRSTAQGWWDPGGAAGTTRGRGNPADLTHRLRRRPQLRLRVPYGAARTAAVSPNTLAPSASLKPRATRSPPETRRRRSAPGPQAPASRAHGRRGRRALGSGLGVCIVFGCDLRGDWAGRRKGARFSISGEQQRLLRDGRRRPQPLKAGLSPLSNWLGRVPALPLCRPVPGADAPGQPTQRSGLGCGRASPLSHLSSSQPSVRHGYLPPATFNLDATRREPEGVPPSLAGERTAGHRFPSPSREPGLEPAALCSRPRVHPKAGPFAEPQSRGRPRLPSGVAGCGVERGLERGAGSRSPRGRGLGTALALEVRTAGEVGAIANRTSEDVRTPGAQRPAPPRTLRALARGCAAVGHRALYAPALRGCRSLIPGHSGEATRARTLSNPATEPSDRFPHRPSWGFFLIFWAARSEAGQPSAPHAPTPAGVPRRTPWGGGLGDPCSPKHSPHILRSRRGWEPLRSAARPSRSRRAGQSFLSPFLSPAAGAPAAPAHLAAAGSRRGDPGPSHAALHPLQTEGLTDPRSWKAERGRGRSPVPRPGQSLGVGMEGGDPHAGREISAGVHERPPGVRGREAHLHPRLSLLVAGTRQQSGPPAHPGPCAEDPLRRGTRVGWGRGARLRIPPTPVAGMRGRDGGVSTPGDPNVFVIIPARAPARPAAAPARPRLSPAVPRQPRRPAITRARLAPSVPGRPGPRGPTSSGRALRASLPLSPGPPRRPLSAHLSRCPPPPSPPKAARHAGPAKPRAAGGGRKYFFEPVLRRDPPPRGQAPLLPPPKVLLGVRPGKPGTSYTHGPGEKYGLRRVVLNLGSAGKVPVPLLIP